MITARVDTRPMEDALSEFAKLGRKSLDEVWRQQGGILVGHVIAITPPGGKNGQSLGERGGIERSAKVRGESRIAADIASIFPTAKAPEEEVRGWIRSGIKVKPTKHSRAAQVRDIAFSLGDMARVHRIARNPQTGRTRSLGGDNMAFARPAMLKAYIRQEQKKVGQLNAGWLKAADDLGTAKRNTPAWITRHGRRGGSSSISRTFRGTTITIANHQTWFPSGMDARVAIALKRREAGLKKAAEAILERRARAAERRMGR